MIEKVTVAVIVVGALSLGNALAADPPVANGRGARLLFELVDGTVITGRIDVKAISIRISSGNVLEIPVAAITELDVGRNNRPAAPKSQDRPFEPRSKIKTVHNTFRGIITVKQFRITSPYGNVTVKLNDIRRIRPGYLAVSIKGGRWSVQLRDKTRLRGVPTGQSLRIETRYGTMTVPLAQIGNAAFTADGKTISVQCWGSNRFVGSLGEKTTISFHADKRKMDIPAGRIAAIAFDTLVLDLGKGVTMNLTLIRGGKFMMGSPKTEAGRKDHEGPQREVTISRPFYMGVCEVTQAQWCAVMDTKPWSRKALTKPGDSYTASFISWDGANKFCERLARQAGKKVTLPTEAQWEYACRAGSKAMYYFGDDSSKLGAYAWYSGNTREKGEKHAHAHAVGQKKPNAFGLYDMHGNVWEWCRGYYDAKFYAKVKDIDPENTTESKFRVLRGGSWYGSPPYCRTARRFRVTANYHNYVSGFRVVVISGSSVD